MTSSPSPRSWASRSLCSATRTTCRARSPRTSSSSSCVSRRSRGARCAATPFRLRTRPTSTSPSTGLSSTRAPRAEVDRSARITGWAQSMARAGSRAPNWQGSRILLIPCACLAAGVRVSRWRLWIPVGPDSTTRPSDPGENGALPPVQRRPGAPGLVRSRCPAETPRAWDAPRPRGGDRGAHRFMWACVFPGGVRSRWCRIHEDAGAHSWGPHARARRAPVRRRSKAQEHSQLQIDL
mmetsp:Transcript_13738/g.46428  ORF Transcript_13738/g.46428 Transcript_13738/m.46428 type:complete len:238 (-) Transcript_13738:347-1060(-)